MTLAQRIHAAVLRHAGHEPVSGDKSSTALLAAIEGAIAESVPVDLREKVARFNGLLAKESPITEHVLLWGEPEITIGNLCSFVAAIHVLSEDRERLECATEFLLTKPGIDAVVIRKCFGHRLPMEPMWKVERRGSVLGKSGEGRIRRHAKGIRMTYRYAWGARLRGMDAAHDANWDARKGQPCEVLARGSMNSALIRFADGYTAVVSRNALRRERERTWTKS